MSEGQLEKAIWVFLRASWKVPWVGSMAWALLARAVLPCWASRACRLSLFEASSGQHERSKRVGSEEPWEAKNLAFLRRKASGSKIYFL